MDVLRRSLRITILTMFSAAILPLTARAQVAPAAYGRGPSLWVGAEYSNISASFPYQSGQRLEGAGVFVDFHMNRVLGLEEDTRFLPFGGFQGSTERNYLAGPNISFFARGKFRPYGKLLVGAGHIHYPFAIGDASYMALAPGAGTEYRIRGRWMLRAEYEYQIWVNSPGYANEPDHNLTPNGFHLGIAYRFF